MLFLDREEFCRHFSSFSLQLCGLDVPSPEMLKYAFMFSQRLLCDLLMRFDFLANTLPLPLLVKNPF